MLYLATDGSSRVKPTCRACRAVRRAAGLPPPDSLKLRNAEKKKRACPVCSTLFLPIEGSRGLSRTCSKSCGQRYRLNRSPELSAQLLRERNRRKNQRRRGRKVLTDGVTDAVIFERDEWACLLCSLPLDREAHYLDRNAPTIDHIVPLSLGGDDTAANKQAAHRGCNSAKGGSNNAFTRVRFDSGRAREPLTCAFGVAGEP